MADLNVVALTGRLAKAPELQYTPSGTAVAKFRLAVGRGKKGEDGKDETDWLAVVCFQKTAELAGQFLDKGSPVSVSGRIQSRTWEDKEGKTQWAVEIVADRIGFLETKAQAEARRGQEGQATAAPAARPAATAAPQQAPLDGGDDPFSDS